MGFWQNVEDECEYRGISRKELAAAAHFSVHTISTGIKRDGVLEADLALRIADALDVPVIELFMERNSENAETSVKSEKEAEREQERKRKLREHLKRELIARMESSLDDLLQMI